jgi:hypothetical protein
MSLPFKYAESLSRVHGRPLGVVKWLAFKCWQMVRNVLWSRRTRITLFKLAYQSGVFSRPPKAGFAFSTRMGIAPVLVGSLVVFKVEFEAEGGEG